MSVTELERAATASFRWIDRVVIFEGQKRRRAFTESPHKKSNDLSDGTSCHTCRVVTV